MRPKKPVDAITQLLNRFRHSLAYIDALPQLSLLGLLVGLFTGAIIALFRWLIELPLSQNLVNHASDFESFTPMTRVLFILGGTSILIALFYCVKKQDREMSVAHVIDRVHNHQGNMPFKNWFMQFLGAVISIISGQSVGREGPAVHLGAGAAGQLGYWLKLPNNSMTTLIGCGVASAIATSFNTPLAGVIFAMEVILKEYNIVGFLPIILASVAGALIGQLIFSHDGDFYFPATEPFYLAELHYMIALGLVIAFLAASYTKLHIAALRFNQYPLYFRMGIAGVITAIVSLAIPEIMGLGYDTLNLAINGKVILTTLVIIVIAKTMVTPVVIALGIPGGLIGPCLMIGALTGAAFAIILNTSLTELKTDTNMFMLVGMAGMMAATINAPLAALVAVLELSNNPSSIFPAMLVIVISCMITRQVFRLDGIFMEQLNHSGRCPDFGPATQALNKAGVRSVMNHRFKLLDQVITLKTLKTALQSKPNWLVFSHDSSMYSLAAADAAHAIEGFDTENPPDSIDLLAIPARRYNMVAIADTANLLQALKTLKDNNTQALYVTRLGPSASNTIQGVVTLADLENYYQPKNLLNLGQK